MSAAPQLPSRRRRGELTQQAIGLVRAGRSTTEIATELGISKQTVSNTLCRARQKGLEVPFAKPSSPPPPLERPITQLSTLRAIKALTPVERIEYELEGVLPIITSHDIADEDLDPNPVPTGCQSCWQGPGAYSGIYAVCLSCPDPTAKERQRADQRQGLALKS